MGKKFMILAAIFGMSCSVSIAQNDVYYIPSKKVSKVKIQEVQQNYDNVQTTTSDNSVNYSVRPRNEVRNVDEYNRRSFVKSTIDDSLKLSTTVESEAISNYSCSKKIIRFHTANGIIISSPYYWDVCYENDIWDVYCDVWAYTLPSWHYWSYAYDPWVYNRWWYRTCWDYTWGWYDPWWGYSYWGWGRPAYWGWSRPWGSWGVVHHVHYYHDCPHWGCSRGFEPGFGRPGGFSRSDYVGGRSNQPGGFRVNNVREGNAGGFASSRGGGLTKGFRVNGNSMQNSGNGGFVTNNNGTMNNRRSYATARGGGNSNGVTGQNNTMSRQNGSFQSNRSNTTTQSRSNEYNRSSTNSNSSYGSSSGSIGRSGGGFGSGSSMGSSPRVGGGGVSRGGGFGGGGGVSRGGGGFGGGGGMSRGGGGGGRR